MSKMFISITRGVLLSFIACYLSLCIAPCRADNLVCYYTNWAQYRPGDGYYDASNVNPNMCTHYLFAFAQLDPSNVWDIIPYETNDNQLPFMYRKLTDIKKYNPNAYVLLALGGFSHGSDRFGKLIASADYRTRFCQRAVYTTRYWGFDGLDVDWEYPDKQHQANFTLLLKELQGTFESESARNPQQRRLLITLAVTANTIKAGDGLDIPALNTYVDMVNVMTYDYHGQWDDVTGLSSPLYAPEWDLFSVEASIKFYIAQGLAPKKINLGIALYARSFTLVDAGNPILGAPISGGGTAAQYTRERGFLSYYEVCLLLKNGYTERFDEQGQLMYAFYGNQFITYENTRTITIKINFAQQLGLGGIMVWSLDMDDFSGKFCGQGANPLLREISKLVKSAPVVVPDTPTTSATTSTTTSTTTKTTTTPTTTTPTTTTPSTTTPTTTTRTTTTPTTTTPATTTPATTTTTVNPTTTASTTPITTKTKTTTKPSSGGTSVWKCPQPNGVFAHPTDCKLYYVCRSSFHTEYTCDGQFVYSPQEKRCVSQSKYSCP